eukprot:3611994-Amphidinium_carterae.2
MSVISDPPNIRIHECSMDIQASHHQSDDILTLYLHTQIDIPEVSGFRQFVEEIPVFIQETTSGW